MTYTLVLKAAFAHHQQRTSGCNTQVLHALNDYQMRRGAPW